MCSPLVAFTRTVTIGAVVACLAVSGTEAHPISLSWANVFVTRERITVRLEIFAEDLFLFHGMSPNEDNYLDSDDLAHAVEKHKQFLLKYFLILNINGEPLTGVAKGAERADLEPQGLHMADLMAYSIFYKLEYDLEKPPEFLTFMTRFGGENTALPSVMEVNLKQEGAGTPQAAKIEAGQPYTVRLDWDNPPLSPTAGRQEWERWATTTRRKTLGITSYSSIYSFIYITDHEVRHEILIPLLTLETWFPIQRTRKEFLEVEEQETARRKIEEFFGQGNPVAVNGMQVKPVVERIDFHGLDLTDFARAAEPRRVSAVNARVGVIISYATESPPREVIMTWDRFNWEIWAIRSTVFPYDQVLKAEFLRDRPTFEWTSPGRPPIPEITPLGPPRPLPKLSLPTISIGCMILAAVALVGMFCRAASRGPFLLAAVMLAGAAAGTSGFAIVEIPHPWATPEALSEDEALAVFTTLHENIYRAFDYHAPSEIHDVLAGSVEGELLSQVYLQIAEGLKMQEQGGAISRIRKVTIVDGNKAPLPAADDTSDPRSFGFRCTWTVSGTVEHWGHIHSRTNEYQALFVVEPIENSWKITGLETINQRRLKFETELRTAK